MRSIYNFFCTYQSILHCLQLFFKQTFPSSQGGVSDKFKRNFTHYAFRLYIFSDYGCTLRFVESYLAVMDKLVMKSSKDPHPVPSPEQMK